MTRIFIFLLLLIFVVGTEFIFADDKTILKTDQEILREAFNQNWVGGDPISSKYINNVLYIGMPESDFVNLFTKREEQEGSLRPYIIKHKDNVYYIWEPEYYFLKKKLGSTWSNWGRSRISFDKGRLIKYEIQHLEKPPFVFPIYTDDTSVIKGFVNKNDKGFDWEISENEFLAKFSGSILKHKRDWYIFWAKDGKKYRVQFLDGTLKSIEPL